MRLELNKDQQRRPHGGHHFPEMGTMVRGDTFKQVVDRVRELRLNNFHPIGNPEQDVLRYYAERFPFMVKVHDGEEPAKDEMYEAAAESIRYVWQKSPAKFITRKEAEIRWKICEACPFHKEFSWPDTEEAAEVQRRAFLLRHGMEIPEKLGFCSCHNMELGVYSLIPHALALSRKKEGVEPPGACWTLGEQRTV